jgi:hypothetical protein
MGDRRGLAGWLISATATIYGAPFWFDMLQKITRLAGTGPAPPTSQAGGPRAAPGQRHSCPQEEAASGALGMTMTLRCCGFGQSWS